MRDPDMPSLTTQNLSKSYGGTHALKNVSLKIHAGDIHALCGENGAGKSTLIKILSGVETPDQGLVQWNGNHLSLGKVHEMESKGIVAVHQEPVVFPDLNIVDNLYAGRELSSGMGTWLNTASMKQRTRDILDSLGEDLPLNQPVGEMALAQRQMVSIARALFNQCRILILDEPTASLTTRESDALFKTVISLKNQGVGILYVSHRLEEVFQLAECISVLRDGILVSTQSSNDLSEDALIQQMVGRKVAYPSRQQPVTADVTKNKPVLELKALSRTLAYDDIHLKIHAGEILGMSGLVGAGRSEIARAIFGIDEFDTGEILFNGKKLQNHSIRKAIDLGIAMVPEDRQRQGLALPLSVETNLLLPSLNAFQGMTGLDRSQMRSMSGQLISKLGIKTGSPDNPASALSGGNQQKIVLGKWIHQNPSLFILDEPTRGVDVGAKSEVHRMIIELAKQGSAVLLISSELPEILSLSDRILVIAKGHVSGELAREEANQEKLLKLSLQEEAKQSP